MRRTFPFTRIKRSTLLWLAVAVIASAPAWIVRYPPIQDLPFHLAAIRVIHDFTDPNFAFDTDFVLRLGSTQYVFYYLLASALAYVLGIVKANILLMSVYLGGTPLAIRELLRALGKDERLALFSVPLLINVMFMFGLLPFVLGIPILFYGLATAVRYFEHPTPKRGVLLGFLASALFYSHVFPFALFGIGFALMFPWTQPRRWLAAAAPVVPALLLVGRWALFTSAGQLTASVMQGGPSHVAPLNAAIPAASQWLVDVWSDTSDELYFIMTVCAAILVTGLAQGDRDFSKPASRAYTLLPLACIYFYFTMPDGHGYIWLIFQRFPILCLMASVPLLRMPSGMRGWLGTALAGSLALGSTINTCKHFITFQLEEVGDIDGALEAMAPRKHVAALIYDKGSKVTNWAPFLHFGSYYQLEKGGVIQFTYAGYAHWPFDFKPGHYPYNNGKARERWEWTPESVSVEQELLPYYDYVLTRGNGFHPPSGTFHVKWHGDRWTVWERDTPR
jgi:hypothetical protein